jgi:hypothetical protein
MDQDSSEAVEAVHHGGNLPIFRTGHGFYACTVK